MLLVRKIARHLLLGAVVPALVITGLTALTPIRASAQNPAGSGLSAPAWTATPEPAGTPTATAQHGQPPLSLTLLLAFTGCSVGLVIGVVVLGAIVSISRKKG